MSGKPRPRLKAIQDELNKRNTPPSASSDSTPRRTHCRSQSRVYRSTSTPKKGESSKIPYTPAVLKDKKYGRVSPWESYFVDEFGGLYSEDATTKEVTRVGRRYTDDYGDLEVRKEIPKLITAAPVALPASSDKSTASPPVSPIRSVSTEPHGSWSILDGSDPESSDSATSDESLPLDGNVSTEPHGGWSILNGSDPEREAESDISQSTSELLSDEEYNQVLNKSTYEELENVVSRLTPISIEIDELEDDQNSDYASLSKEEKAEKINELEAKYDSIMVETFGRTPLMCSFGDLCIE